MQFEWEFPNTVECEEVKTCYWKLEKELESRSSGNQWNQFLKQLMDQNIYLKPNIQNAKLSWGSNDHCRFDSHKIIAIGQYYPSITLVDMSQFLNWLAKIQSVYEWRPLGEHVFMALKHLRMGHWVMPLSWRRNLSDLLLDSWICLFILNIHNFLKNSLFMPRTANCPHQ